MIPRPEGVVRAGLLIYVPIGLLAFAWICVRQGMAGAIARLVGDHPLRDLVLGLGVGLMLVGLTRLASATLEYARRAEAVLGEALGALTLTQCVTLAAVSGIAEELVFRGILQPWLGLIVASILFGLAHVPMRRELLMWPVFAALVGALLGWMAHETGGLLAPILAHVTVNAVNLRFIARAAPVEDEPIDVEP